MPKIDWNKIQESNALILKDNEPIRVRFLDNGLTESMEIFDKKTEKLKTIDKYSFDVLDLTDNTEKELSIIQTTLMTKLKYFIPLKDKEIIINRFRTGISEFDIDYKVSLIE